MNWNNLDKLSDMLQVINFYLLVMDSSNNQIMKELDRQDKEYLEKISDKLDKLLEREINI